MVLSLNFIRKNQYAILCEPLINISGVLEMTTILKENTKFLSNIKQSYIEYKNSTVNPLDFYVILYTI